MKRLLAAALLASLLGCVPTRARDLPSTQKSPFDFPGQGVCVGVLDTTFDGDATLKNVTEWNGSPACADFGGRKPGTSRFWSGR